MYKYVANGHWALNTFFGVRIVYICSETVLLKNLSTRIHSFNEKNI